MENKITEEKIINENSLKTSLHNLIDKENQEENEDDDNITKLDLERYCRQMILPQIQREGQQKIKNAKVLVIGAGGLGSPCLMYLAGAGIGTIGIVDGDSVDTSNLHRQVIHKNDNNSKNKSESAAEFIRNFNPNVNIITHKEHLSNTNCVRIAKDYDLIVDCTDNPATRYLISDTAVYCDIPLVSGAAVRWEGQLTILVRNSIDKSLKNKNLRKKLPCYRCLFPVPSPTMAVGSCSDEGVVGTVPGFIGVLQATEVIKIIIGEGEKTLSERMMFYDALEMKSKIFKIKGAKKDCKICGENGEIKNDNFIENFDYQNFTSPKSCQLPKRMDIPSQNNITWNKIINENIENFNENNIGDSKENKRKYFIIDCRPKEQFNMFNLNNLQSMSKTKHIVNVNDKEKTDNEKFVIKHLISDKNNTYINIPFLGVSNMEHIIKNYESQFTTDKDYLFLCRAGNISTHVVKYFIDNKLDEKYGIKNVYNVENGILGYRSNIDKDNVPYF